MGTLVATHELTTLDIPNQQQVYNALDCCVTLECWQSLQTLFNTVPEIYTFELALQAPALEMMMRGWKIDFYARDLAVTKLKAKLARLEFILERMVKAVWNNEFRRNKDGRAILPNSHEELKKLFYGHMKIKEMWTSVKGERKLQMDREALEKLELYFHARPIVSCVLAIRDTAKQIEVLHKAVDPDGRMRTSINVGATETGRFSSSKSTTGTGGNLFNISEEQRQPFIADKGWKICGIDLEQAESREVGWICWQLFNDPSYLDACEAGDLHTSVAKLVWPDLGWTGNPIEDRKIADVPHYRFHTRRFMAKKFGHASNYLISPWTASRQIKCPITVAESFQDKYFSAFKCIQQWHQWTAEQIQSLKPITTDFGRVRHFFGKPNDDATLREAIAFRPQSQTADRLNIGLYRIWKKLGTRIQILLQLYDAVYFQYREDDDEAEVISTALSLICVPQTFNGRVFDVPGEAKVGWNWREYIDEGNNSELNLDGMKKWKGKDDRKRSSILDQIL